MLEVGAVLNNIWNQAQIVYMKQIKFKINANAFSCNANDLKFHFFVRKNKRWLRRQIAMNNVIIPSFALSPQSAFDLALKRAQTQV